MITKKSESSTREKLLDAAEALMLSKGYVAATVDEVCTGAGVTKGSFFHYFKNKEELGKILLQRFARAQGERFIESCSSIEDPLERVYRIIDMGIEAAQHPDFKGCLIGTLAQEISETHPELRQVCECAFDGFSSSVTQYLIEAKKRHAPSGDFDAESLGHYTLSVVQGSMLVLKATGHREGMVGNLTHLKNYLKSLYGL